MRTADHTPHSGRTGWRASDAPSLWRAAGDGPLPLALTDQRGAFLGANRALCSLLHQEEDSLLRVGLDRVLHPDDLAEEESLTQKLLSGEMSSYQARQRYRRRDGAVVAVNATVWPAHVENDAHRLFRLLQPIDAGADLHAEDLLGACADAVSACSADGTILFWNAAAERLYGVASDEAIGRALDDALAPEWIADTVEVLGRATHGEWVEGYEAALRRGDGAGVVVTLSAIPFGGGRHLAHGAWMIARDITEQRRAESLLAGQARALELIAGGARLDEILDSLAQLVDAQTTTARCSILVFDDDCPGVLRFGGGLRLPGIERVALEDLAGDPPGGAQGTAAIVVADLATDPRWAPCRELALALGLRTCWSSPIVLNGAARALGIFALFYPQARSPSEEDWDLLRRLTRVAALGINRYRSVEKLTQRAIHDPLTGAANRVLASDRLHVALERARRDGSKVAVLFLDLDGFKALNDRHGHEAGDKVLIELVRRLKGGVRPGDTVARLGGDEFVVVCDRVLGALEAIGIADRVADAVAAPFEVDGRDYRLTASIGVAFSQADSTPDSMLEEADAAMYQAKDHGKARFQLFDTAMHERAVTRLRTASELREALIDHRFHLLYQPLVSLDEDVVVGMEALLRWNHPERGSVEAAEFLPVADAAGLSVAIGTWALGEAFRQGAEWQVGAHLRMHVNVSARQLGAELVSLVRSALAVSGADPAGICLEFGETALMADVEMASRVLRDLKELGACLSIDNFGTGMSRLADLDALPLDELKIDGSLTQRIRGDERERIVTAMARFAHALDLRVVAEGVENHVQAAQLRGMGCDVGQGHHWSRPVPPGELNFKSA